MIKKFIERPVLSTVISILIVMLGLLGLRSLPVQQFPEIALPTVNVTANYYGANAETVIKTVVTPLEEAINGVEGMEYITSTASNSGSVSINVYFKLGTNADIAAVNVQNAVASVTNKLPSSVVAVGIVTKKIQNSILMFAQIYSENEDFSYNFLENYSKINVVPVLQRVQGVGDVGVFGARDYSMRVWLDPAKMATFGLIPDEVNAAIKEQNIEAAPGRFGADSDESFEFVIRYKGRLSTVDEYKNIILRSEGNGNFLRLKDVARVELGAFSYSIRSNANGHPASIFAIKQTAGSNAKATITEVENVLDEMAENFPPGVKYAIGMNSKDFLDASIHEVLKTLLEAFILVFIVVFVFLQDLRSTLIPAISIPVAIIGTFFFLNLFGFSINLLTLFALVLAIGIVVDDAIVVVEAVHGKLESGIKEPRKAAISAMSEITGAIVSITLVMSAVFIPVTFITGPTGVFYKQFAITLAIAIVLSAVNALTLSPALCALFLKPKDEGNAQETKKLGQRMSDSFNLGFTALTDKYVHAVKFLTNKKWIAIGILVVFSGLAVHLFNTTPAGFIPTEDMGTIYCDVDMPAGTTLEQTAKVTAKLEAIFSTLDVIDAHLFVTGYSMMSSSLGSSKSLGVIKLKPWDERTADKDQVQAIVGQLYGLTAGIKEGRVLFFTPPTVRGFGNVSGFEFQMQDKSGGDLKAMESSVNAFMAKLMKRPEIKYVRSTFSTKYPQIEMEVNLEKIKEAGIQYNTLFSTLQAFYGSAYVSDFNKFGKQYRVVLQASPADRATAESLNSVYIKNNKGEMVAVSQFINLNKTNGPDVVNRFNLFNAVKISGAVNDGYSTGDAITAIKEVAAEEMPQGFGYEFSGMTREEQKSGSESAMVFVLSLIFVYFLLCAQYESYIIPFSVILSLPVGVAGAIGFVNLFGLENNIYFQVSLIMLIGLLAKNAILIVEFALQHRRNGAPIAEAAIEGARQRLRPIIMTSFAFILGLSPLMFSQGAGAIGNQSIGTGAIGGMLVGTVFGVFVIPALFVIFQSLQERIIGGTKVFSERLVEVEVSEFKDETVHKYEE